MEAATIGTILQVAATVVMVIAFSYSVTRNSRRAMLEEDTLKTTLSIGLLTLTNKLDHPINGLTAIKEEVGRMKENCAVCQERIKRSEKDIEGLRTRGP